MERSVIDTMRAMKRMRCRIGGLWADESGQSYLFAILTLFLLLAGMGYAYNVSLVVSKRVRLQNAADAAALSGAIAEANALSAIAWLNGCQTYIHSRMQEIVLDVPYTATAAATAEWGRYIMDQYGRKTYEMQKGLWTETKYYPVEWNHGEYKTGLLGIVNQFTNMFNEIQRLLDGLTDDSDDVTSEEALKIQQLLTRLKALDDAGQMGSPEYMQTLDELEELGLDVDMLRASAKMTQLENERDLIQKDLNVIEANLVADLKILAAAETAAPTCNPLYHRATEGGKGDEYNFLIGRYKEIAENADGRLNAYDVLQKQVEKATENKNAGSPTKISTISTPVTEKTNLWYDSRFNSFVTDTKDIIKRGTVEGTMPLFNGLPRYVGPTKDYTAAFENYLNTGVTKSWMNTKDYDLNKDCMRLHVKHMKGLNAAVARVNENLDKMAAHRKRLYEIFAAMKKEKKKIEEASGGELSKEERDKLYDYSEIIESERKNKKAADQVPDLMRSTNDPPEIWSVFKMIPIPIVNPNGPTPRIGRMTPLGTPYAGVDIDDPPHGKGYERPGNPFLANPEKYGDSPATKDGLPIWEELVVAMAGPFGEILWPQLMKEKYGFDGVIRDTDDFLDFFHNVLVPEAKKWVGYRAKGGSGGIRPGESWIRQLSQIATAIAVSMPEMVRNEIMYSVSINASPRTLTAIFPDPGDSAKWGEVALAQTDREAGEAFFRYDGWFSPPNVAVKGVTGKKGWIPPPNYVNMYTAANSSLPLVKAAVEFNNPAVWTDTSRNPGAGIAPGRLFANRFLNESRRQNLQLRRVELPEHKDVRGMLSKGNSSATSMFEAAKKQALSSYLHLPVPAYSMLVDATGKPNSDPKRLGYFRMRYGESFYWDEYAGRVGGDADTDGAGSGVRVAVKCWNQNDRTWRAPKSDSDNNNVLSVDLGFFKQDGLSSPAAMTFGILPFPGPGSGQWNPKAFFQYMGRYPPINKNLAPRCQTGYAPGSNVLGMGHPLFVPSHGDPEKEDGAADGHWHYMHYHAHSESCQVVFPGIAGCKVFPINCIIYNLIAMPINALIDAATGDHPNRTGWDGTAHYPYKHWDGTVMDDEDDAISNHIFCRISSDNEAGWERPLLELESVFRGLGDDNARTPPYAIPIPTSADAALALLPPPLNLYSVCFFKCPSVPIIPGIIELCICAGENNCFLTGGGLHGSSGDFSYMPKDLIPLYNTPYLWNRMDSDPSIITLFGANLHWGDLEGDPTMFIGSGDQMFYPEMFYNISNERATGRNQRFTQILSGADWSVFGKSLAKNIIKDVIEKILKDKLGPIADLFGKLFENDFLGVPSPDIQGEGDIVNGPTFDLYKFSDKNITGFNATMTTLVDLLTRWGHHRFLVCPLCMSFCPIPDCDFHKRTQRHWGGDYGGATDLFDTTPAVTGGFGGIVGAYLGAVSQMSVLPALFASGDQQADAGMSYNSVMRGHDLYRNQLDDWKRGGAASARAAVRQKGKHVVMGGFDLGIDLDDGLEGNGWRNHFGSGNPWYDRFPADRFIQEWMSPVDPTDSTTPDTSLAPTVVVTENFMRHAVTVILVEEYKPFLWGFGKARPLVAVATAKCGFVERDALDVDGTAVAIDGRGAANGVAQIITGIGEPAADREGGGAEWDLDEVWDFFLDFPNKAPLGESNLYYANWGAKLVPTRYGILRNREDTYDEPRRSSGGFERFTRVKEAHIKLWALLGQLECYQPNGARAGRTVAASCGMDAGQWQNFATRAVGTSRKLLGEYD